MAIIAIGAALLPWKLKSSEAPAPPAATAAAPTTTDFTFTEEEAVKLAQSLVDAVDPADLGNNYLSEFAKEKITWLYSAVAEKKADLKFEFSPEWSTRSVGDALMRADYINGMPIVFLHADRLMVTIKLDGRTPVGFTRTQKNQFAIVLVYEIVHLERGREWFNSRGNNQKLVDEEEFRTYSKVDQMVVTPLLQMGEPVDTTHLNLHPILTGCKYQLPCQPFLEFRAKNK